jgi:GTP-binding protein
MFVDAIRVFVAGGDGGHGAVSFGRQAHEPKGPPDGGDGGDGGAVVVRADPGVATLADYHHRPHRRAGRGGHGGPSNRQGARGDEELLSVPVGTIVVDEGGEVIADLATEGALVVLAAGGRGGRGNGSLRSSSRRAPAFAELGEPAAQRTLRLELKLVVDAALVGLPNAGKSSLIARLSAAKPKIADYPFTSLAPTLGVVRTDDADLVVADVPGLIEGASDGRGLGDGVLRHTERAAVLVHVLDCASYERRDPVADLDTVSAELAAYSQSLAARPALVFANKADAEPDVAELARMELEPRGWEVVVGSAATEHGVDALRYRLAELVASARAEAVTRDADAERPYPVGSSEPEESQPRPVLRPVGGGDGFSVTPEPAGEDAEQRWRVTGDEVERWVAMTDLRNSEALAYLQQRLVDAGLDRRLASAGARVGDTIVIGETSFAFDPDPGVLPAEEPALAESDAGESDAGESDAGEPDAVGVVGEAAVISDADETGPVSGAGETRTG